jgi:hypothetical protein
MAGRKPEPADAPRAFLVKTGLSYDGDRRAEPGDIVTDIPTYAQGWLLEQGHIALPDTKEA